MAIWSKAVKYSLPLRCAVFLLPGKLRDEFVSPEQNVHCHKQGCVTNPCSDFVSHFQFLFFPHH